MGNRTVGALAGLMAAAAALAVTELVAVFTGSESAPLAAIGAVVVDRSPDPVTEFGIRVFGVHDKSALLIGTLILLAAAVLALGAAAADRLWIGAAGLAGFTAIGVAAALTRHDASPTAALPTLLAAVVAGAVFLGLLRRFRPAQPSRPAFEPALEPALEPVATGDPPQPVGGVSDPRRRQLLRATGLVVVGALAVGVAGRWIGTRRGVTSARASVELPTPVDPAPPVPDGADLALPDLAEYVTPNDSFYRIDTALVVPRVDPADWRLRIHGRVRHPYEISFADLLARPMIERHITLACVSNQVGGDLIGNAHWLGVPVAELLAEAEPLPGADQVVSRSVDGWTCGTPTEVLTDGRDALLAVGMNGAPLPPDHGFPVRMVVPGLYGYVSACKWITELELSSFADFDAYWVPRGWAAQAPIKTQSRIDTPRRRAAAGTVTVAGVAWAQHRGIDKVEVQVDDGPWQEAVLADTVSADTWRQWWWRWEGATPGEHEITVRATDSDGLTQPVQPSPPAPDGATGWHTVRIDVG